MRGRDLIAGDITLLAGILSRREPDLVAALDHLPSRPLGDGERERIRRAIVDELCELPSAESDRRALELEELLIHLGEL